MTKKHASIKEKLRFNPVLTAVKMQLKDKSARSSFLAGKPAFFRYIFDAVKFVLFTAVFWALFFALTQFHLISLNFRVPSSFVVFVFTIIEFILIIASSFSLSKQLYFSDDNKLLFTFPLTHFQVFISKMIVFLLEDLKRNAFVFFPLFIATGIVSGMSAPYYFWLLLMYPLITLISFSLGSLFSLVFTFVGKIFSRFRYTGIVTVTILLLTIAGLFVWLVLNLPKDFDLIGKFGYYYGKINAFLVAFSKGYNPFSFVGTIVLGSNYNMSINFRVTREMVIIIAIFVGIIAIVFTGAFFLQRFFFYKVATSENNPQEGKHTKRENRPHRPFLSNFMNEWQGYGREPLQFISRYIILLLTPFVISTLVLVVSAQNARFHGLRIAVAFALFILLIGLLTSNVYASSMLSSDGKAAYHLKTSPTPPRTVILSKLLTHAIIHLFVIIICITICAVILETISPLVWVFATISVLALDLGHVFYSIGLDLSNPQHHRYVSNRAVSTNPNETASIAFAFVVSGIYFGVQLFSLFAVRFPTPSGIYWREMIACLMYAVFYVIYFRYQYKVYIRSF